jgi:hypothetical protein
LCDAIDAPHRLDAVVSETVAYRSQPEDILTASGHENRCRQAAAHIVAQRRWAALFDVIRRTNPGAYAEHHAALRDLFGDDAPPP